LKSMSTGKEKIFKKSDPSFKQLRYVVVRVR
jgi:hypothetical protein